MVTETSSRGRARLEMGVGGKESHRKASVNDFGGRFQELLVGALDLAFVEGVKRERVAFELGVSIKTLQAWVEPNRQNLVPGPILFELCAREDVLPGEARDFLVTRLCAEFGYTAVADVDADLDESPVSTQLLEIEAALGDTCRACLAAIERRSEHGARLSGRELDVMEAHLTELATQVGQLRQGVRRAKKVAR